MLFKSPTIIKYLQEKLHFSDFQIKTLQMEYMDYVFKCLLNQVFLYLEKNNEKEKIDKINKIKDNIDNGNMVENYKNFIVEVTDIFNEYPVIQENFEKDMDRYDDTMADALLENISDDDYIELMEEGAKEIAWLDRMENKDNLMKNSL